MMARVSLRSLRLLLALAVLPAPAWAQAQPPAVMPPPSPLLAPEGIRSFPTPPQVVGRELLL